MPPATAVTGYKPPLKNGRSRPAEMGVGILVRVGGSHDNRGLVERQALEDFLKGRFVRKRFRDGDTGSDDF